MSKYLNFYIKGIILSAKIYSDVRDNTCECGGKFNKKIEFKKLTYPACNSCGEDPPKFRIMARIQDEFKNNRSVTVRRNQAREPLTNVIDALATLRVIDQELEAGTFDLRKYESKAKRESLLFENFQARYMEHNERKYERDELSKNGLRDKYSLINKHLLPFFKGIGIDTIRANKIEEFRDSYIDKLRARDKALAELKTILRWAKKMDEITNMPHFDRIPKSKQRKHIPTIEEVKKVIEVVDPYYSPCFKMLAIYPIRPCELRCLRWKDIDLKERKMTISRHMSGRDEIQGRKSVKGNHVKATITYPLTDEAYFILTSLPTAIDKELLVFASKQGHNNIIGHGALPTAWRNACKKAGVKPFDSYEIKHARITEITELSNGNMVEVMEASGHTNINTVMRYSKSKTDLTRFFQ